MKKANSKTIPRNIYAVIASQKPRQIFHHRSAPRGGDINESRNLIHEYEQEKEEDMRDENEVWLVQRGERNEGGDVIGGFYDKNKAIKFALEQESYFDGGWKKEYDNPANIYWTNGCDFVEVFKIIVK